MAVAPDDKTISKTNTGFPQYLDFTSMRSAAIEYLGKLSGKIWTDYNVHDPGITILESLIYALLDLGYRVNLPAADLFTRDPADKTRDNNFFKASAILANNPLTITDYRKLLVDLKGVKNAWLVTDESIPAVFCNNQEPGEWEAEHVLPDEFCACSNLNGLYHVYIQLEDGIETNKHLYQKTISNIRASLMAHRNLCEDFIDIKVLCKLDLGICAEIDLEKNADAEIVYVAMVEALQEFLSPAPKFYSLQELLDKQKPIEEIFAGRPYNITSSHGFVDTDEFEQLTLRKELHLSDVYQLLFNIPGVSRVRNLGWIKCCQDNTASFEWKLVLPENNIPAFSSKCSGFIFTRNGLPEKVDLKKFESYFEMKFSGSQKALYTTPSSFLDPVLPQGIYRSDLADYYSIQNEFPSVYGIREGGLSSDEPDKRKAQALQLQGFLLFFDQLLANYLMQLKNTRSLFSLSSSSKAADNHTYFINKLTDAPQLEKLLRFHVDASAGTGFGVTGSILAYPTSRANIQAMINNGSIGNADLERRCNNPCEDDFPEYPFCFTTERDLALNQLKDDFLFGNYDPVITSNVNGCYYFYFFTTSDEIALISKQYYSSQKLAADAAASVKYAATFTENYRPFMKELKSGEIFFYFDVELNLDVYAKYLQLIVENENLYTQRRQDFLDHLLSRFAESFTDFALLSAPFTQPDSLATLEIQKEERFLSAYDDISSNRGKAYNYLTNKWNNNNISGFEKRVKALAGIDNWKRHYLCNFEVAPADKLYKLSVLLFNLSFAVEERTFNALEGMASLTSIFKKWLCPVFEYRFLSYSQQYQVFVQDDYGNQYGFNKLFPLEEQAKSTVQDLDAAFKFRPDLSTDIFISRYIYKIMFKDAAGNSLAEAQEHFISQADAEKLGRGWSGKLSSALNNKKEFLQLSRNRKPDKLLPVVTGQFPYVYINETDFEIRQVTVIHLKEERKSFSILNKEASFQFDAVNNYSDTKTVKEKYIATLKLISLPQAYSVVINKQTELFEIFVGSGVEKLVRYFESFATPELANQKIQSLLQEITGYTYQLSITDKIPDEWEFRYRSANDAGESIDYTSRGNFKLKADAANAAILFYTQLQKLTLTLNSDGLTLSLKDNTGQLTALAAIPHPGAADLKRARSILEYSKGLYKAVTDTSEKTLEALLETNRTNPGEDYIYRLVDKDNLIAYYSQLPGPGSEMEAATIRDNLVQQALTGYQYIDIALGDYIRIRKDNATKTTWYHYLLKCNNRKYQQGALAGQDLILFESIQGYPTEEEAKAAFNEQYLQVLKYARNPNNYGNCQYISLVEILNHTTSLCNNSKSIVFVPNETNAEWGGYEVQKILSPMAASYPIRLLRKGKYIFILGQLNEVAQTFTIDWKSKTVYADALTSMQQFQFFLILLKYPGNFYIEYREIQCDYRIYIREVLAISAHGFATVADAWGEQGVEKLICTAQSSQGFHNYVNRLTCRPGFYLACNNTGLVHPCSYDTPGRRDQVMDQLFQAAPFSFLDLVQLVDATKIVLTDLNKNPLVQINIDTKNELNYSNCEWLLHFAESVYQEHNYIKKDGSYSLNYRYTRANEKLERYYKLAEPVVPGMSLKTWKQELKKIACYFPIKRTANNCNAGANDQFRVEIKLPGFDPCCKDVLSDDPCSTPCTDPGCFPSCYLAWKSDCCFDDCCAALNFYLTSLLLLKKIEYYRPLYDCNCGAYGIALHPDFTLKGRLEFMKQRREIIGLNKVCIDDINNSNNIIKHNAADAINFPHIGGIEFCYNEIVAFNPQYYSSEQMACTAVERSMLLVNSEGLHLVEHILLRPRCQDANGIYTECDCNSLPVPCSNPSVQCHFPWIPGGDPDPCAPEIPACFTPGCDPYSFIATVIMPAWPERFRSASGRKIMEKLLQREAPAHVLLRVLWLQPRDFCCLESYSKLWCEWLAKKLCAPDSIYCSFLALLFKKEYQLLPNCNNCLPCDCGEVTANSCSPQTQDPCAAVDMTTNLNKLFCWSNDPEIGYDYCNPGSKDPLGKTVSNKITDLRKKAIPVSAPTKKSTPKSPVTGKKAHQVKTEKSNPEPGSVKITAIKDQSQQKQPSAEKAAENTLRDKFRLVQSRAHYYEVNIESVHTLLPEKDLVINALIFLKKSKPLPQQFIELAVAIAKDRTNTSKEIKGLSKSQKQILIENITWKYLDAVCFNGKDLERILALKDCFAQLKMAGLDMQMIWKGWDAGKLSAFEEQIDFKKIRKIVMG